MVNYGKIIQVEIETQNRSPRSSHIVYAPYKKILNVDLFVREA
jgi:hypothetical protein